MRILCFERDNQTQFTCPGPTNETYMASFELFPFYEGSSYSLYKGLLNGKGPLRGDFCVVRTTLERAVEPSVWSIYMLRSAQASSLATKFNKYIGFRVISFQSPLLTKVDTVSDFSLLFRCLVPHDKRLYLEEYVVLEPFIEGKFRYQFDLLLQGADDGLSDQLNDGCCSEAAPADETSSKVSNVSQWPNLAEAFSHFTWHATRSLLVCGLQGVFKDLVYTFTNPTIHSVDLRYGQTDRGVAAISEFFANHLCNNVCCGWEAYKPNQPAPTNVVTVAPHEEQLASLRQKINPRRHSNVFTSPSKVTPKQFNRVSYPCHPDLIHSSGVPDVLNNESYLQDYLRKHSWQSAIPGKPSDQEVNSTYVCNKLVFPDKITENRISKEHVHPVKFYSQLHLPNKQNLALPVEFTSYHELADHTSRNAFQINRESVPFRELGAHGGSLQETESRDQHEKRDTIADLASDDTETRQEQQQPQLQQHSINTSRPSKDHASYYSCNPAEPSRPLRRDNGYQISLV